ncbi:trypsin-like peptidase domain-containing protein [Streptomyces sp. NPDC096030]|uniref:VMAP-C domain-containing protein n=1 Tax=Streptomyces sp. NPDC096030 TaxID=3155423 RepID=UPI00332EF56E
MDPRRLALIRCGTDQQRHGVGSGYLIAPRLVLTARHVLVHEDTGTFWPEIRVRVGHPDYAVTAYERAELLWEHPGGLDVALLRVDSEMGASSPVPWGRPAGKVPLQYDGLGFPKAAVDGTRQVEHLRGVLSPLSGSADRYVLDQGPAPAAGAGDDMAWGGASGAAVFCDDHLVAVVVREPKAFAARRLFAVPVHSFVEDVDFVAHVEAHGGGSPGLTVIGTAASLPKAGPAAERPPAERELEKLLTPLFADTAVRFPHARDLARDLGYDADGYEPTLADLAALLMAHPRALASLGGALAATGAGEAGRDRLTALFFQAQILEGGSLLSQSEYEELFDLLRGLCKDHSTLLPRAAREALRYTVLPESLTLPRLPEDLLGNAIEELEALFDSETVPHGTPPVPALLRLVEYVAAASDPETAAGLRSWTAAAATRLGIHPDALGERRRDAARWAEREGSPVARLVMTLERDDSAKDERYRCTFLLARADGSQSVLHEAGSLAKTPREAARSLREAVAAAREEPGQGDHVPWVTVEVGRRDLRLAVDDWESEALHDFMPAQPIGADYRVTLSCPELSELRAERDGDQSRRWKHGRMRALVTDPTCVTSQQLRHLLENDHRDVAQVVLNAPAGQQESWLALCLALGVPVVLFDRGADSYDDSPKLGHLAPAGGLDGLPERVREHRSRSLAYPGEHQARPALVWEPDGRHPAPAALRLGDPRKGTYVS